VQIFAGREERIEVRFRFPGREGPAAFWDVPQICVTWWPRCFGHGLSEIPDMSEFAGRGRHPFRPAIFRRTEWAV
jgi:hypothetical protein